MITLQDLLANARLRLTLSMYKGKGVYEDHYINEIFPRLLIIRLGDPFTERTDQYFVDGIACENLEAVLLALNSEPPPGFRRRPRWPRSQPSPPS
jgi:hypothetical protein